MKWSFPLVISIFMHFVPWLIFSSSVFVPFVIYMICLFQPQYSYVDGDETVSAESAKVLYLTFRIMS